MYTKITNEQLIEEYCNNDKSASKIAREYKTTHTTVIKKLRELGIKTKTNEDYYRPILKVKCNECNVLFKTRETIRKFCSSSCSAKLSNKIRERKGISTRAKPKKCENCGHYNKSYDARFCSRECFQAMRHKKYIDGWLDGKESGAKGLTVSSHVKRWLIETRGNKCEICNWAEINSVTGNVPIHVDHIDGKSINNRLENLKILCPNCHSLTPTYGALNMGNSTRPKLVRKKDI